MRGRQYRIRGHRKSMREEVDKEEEKAEENKQ